MILQPTFARRAVVLAGLLLLAGCAFTPAELELKPKVSAAPSTIGQGRTIAFRFMDERDDVTIGHRSVATVGAKITAQKLPDTIEANLRDILAQKQFRLVEYQQPADAEVIYRLRSFKFNIETGFFTGGQNAAAALAVDARRQGKPYNSVYRYNSEERILFVPPESDINKQMNDALSVILTKAATDAELDRFLVGR